MDDVIGFGKFLWEMLYDWPMGTIFGLLFGLLIAVIAIFILFIVVIALAKIFEAIDSWFVSEIKGVGIIEEKTHKDPYVSSDIDVISKMPISVYHEASWVLCISINGKIDSTEVNEKYFKSKKEGQNINVSYVFGRISKSLYLKSINE